VLIVSVDARNRREHIDSVLTIPFGSAGVAGPTVMQLEPGETGLPGSSYLKGHFVSVLKKAQLKERGRSLSGLRMRQVVMLIRRSLDPDAPAWQPPAP
jgi:mRNA-degrading endonuclease toxin of MazEF toxin-antitoxin module